MRLSAMMRLMVEDVLEDISDPLLLWLTAGGSIAMYAIQLGVIVAPDDGYEAFVFFGTSVSKFMQIVMDNGIEPIRVLTLAGKAAEPQPVSHEHVIERAMEAIKKNADGTPVGLIGQRQCGCIQACISPSIVRRKLVEDSFGHKASTRDCSGFERRDA